MAENDEQHKNDYVSQLPDSPIENFLSLFPGENLSKKSISDFAQISLPGINSISQDKQSTLLSNFSYSRNNQTENQSPLPLRLKTENMDFLNLENFNPCAIISPLPM